MCFDHLTDDVLATTEGSHLWSQLGTGIQEDFRVYWSASTCLPQPCFLESISNPNCTHCCIYHTHSSNCSHFHIRNIVLQRSCVIFAFPHWPFDRSKISNQELHENPRNSKAILKEERCCQAHEKGCISLNSVCGISLL